MDEPIISKNIRVRHPEYFSVGEGSIIDDFCYFSTKVVIGRYSHIASSCTVAGGIDRTFSLGDYSSVSSGARIWCTSDDFVNDLITVIPKGIKGIKENLITGDVVFGNFTGVGANSVVMPHNEIPEGTAIGALSFVPPGFQFKPWSVYVGFPIRFFKARNRDSVLRQVEKLERQLRARSQSV